MRTIRRRLFASVSALSLILCLAMVGLWVRSYWRLDHLDRESGDTRVEFQTNRGRMLVLWVDYNGDPRFLKPWTHRAYPVARIDRPKFNFGRWDQPWGRHIWLGFSLWLPALLFAFAPAWWVVGPRRRQSKRRKLGLCLHCGYDLRASPQRCPECGKEKDEG